MSFFGKTVYFFLVFFLSSLSFSQSVTETLNSDDISGNSPPLVNEKIEKVSLSGRIFVLTNSNGSFSKGDFVSLVLGNKLMVRSLVAKVSDGSAGLKIMKVYNPTLWKSSRPGLRVQVIRGDDSYWRTPQPKVADNEESAELIKEEEDLYNEAALVEEGLELDENKSRLIKTDNLITVYLGFIEGLDAERNAKRYNQFNGSWMYQFEDNIWGEVSYGQNIVKGYPIDDFDTKLTNLTFKIKYTVGAPFFSYIQPYVGYQIVNASSPGAGADTDDDQQAALEIEMVEDLKKNSAVFGLTVLKRLVPGWFFRADLGSDILSIGFGLEF